LTLSPGTKLGPYEILAPIGAGGMGEVYRARDTRLGREVAVKVLPQAFARNADRMARFEREARLLAALNHPNIATIHGLEESSGVVALVMELVEGPTLADRIAGGPIPLDEALPIVSQVAAALESAHEKGIIHRDLKPANIKVKPDGGVKVLDFGLAKALAESPPGLDPDKSPTISMAASMAGVVLGTAAYMSPEQARGKLLDKRTDIWAFGCVLFECLTGRRAFPGETATDTIAAVLEREPDWSALPDKTPTGVRRALRRCLQKDLQRRLRDIADARMEIEDALAAASSGPLEARTSSAIKPQRAWWRSATPWMIATGLMIVLAVLLLWTDLGKSAPPPPEVRWVQVSTPFLSLAKESTIDISRDGSRLVYVGEQDGKRQLYLRPLYSQEDKPIPGTENALCPFFSPDGQWLGFWADQKLWKQPLSGGRTPLYDAPLSLWALPLKANWQADGWILLPGIEARGVLQRVRDDGGTPEPLVRADMKRDEWYLYQPEMLPDGDHILFTASLPGLRVVAQSLKTGQRQILVEDAYAAHYTPTGHLVYVQGEKLMAVPFDPKRLVKTGTPTVLVEEVNTWAGPGGADYAISDNGTLAYLSPVRASVRRTFVWVDRQGREEPLANVSGFFQEAQLSPDGKKLTTWIRDDLRVYVLDIGRGALTPLTPEGRSAWNIWSPDGRRLVFNSIRTDSPGTSLFSQVEDGSSPAERLTTTDLMQQPRSFSPDGSILVFQELHPDTGYDIWTLPMKAGAKPTPLLKTRFNEFQPALSHDGRWMAYVSNESGRDEIWVRSFPAMDQRVKVSNNGGEEPIWSRDGRELFYRTSNNPSVSSRVLAVNVSTASGFRADTPRTLFDGPYVSQPLFGQAYDISPDGKRFVMIKFEPQKSPKEINIVFNWFEELKRRVPSGKK